MTLADRLLGDPYQQTPQTLRRGLRGALRVGAEVWVAGALRKLGLVDPGAAEVLLPALLDPHAAVRRAAAFGLSVMPFQPTLQAPLLAAFSAEHTEDGKVRLGLALARQGGDLAEIRRSLDTFHARTLETCGGPRQPAAVLDVAAPRERFELGWGDGLPMSELRSRRAAKLSGDDARAAQALWGLAALGHPDDTPTLAAMFAQAGRRGEHGLIVALGLHGDPRHQPLLEGALTSTQVDPGRGFAWRRLAATAIGQLGLRASRPLLTRALVQEALDFEGRPGSGLGIQYPVRTNLLVAIGEIGDVAAAPELVSYLGNTHGSALGGFYLPAAEGLVRLGPAAIPAIYAGIRGAPEVLVANAVAVLGALGQDISAFAQDSRPQVADVARRVLKRRAAG